MSIEEKERRQHKHEKQQTFTQDSSVSLHNYNHNNHQKQQQKQKQHQQQHSHRDNSSMTPLFTQLENRLQRNEVMMKVRTAAFNSHSHSHGHTHHHSPSSVCAFNHVHGGHENHHPNKMEQRKQTKSSNKRQHQHHWEQRHDEKEDLIVGSRMNRDKLIKTNSCVDTNRSRREKDQYYDIVLSKTFDEGEFSSLSTSFSSLWRGNDDNFDDDCEGEEEEEVIRCLMLKSSVRSE